MSSATLTSKGQITIPKKVRDALDLESGDRLEFSVRDDGVVEVRPRDVDLLNLVGTIKPRRRGVTIDQMNGDVLAAHRGRHEQAGRRDT